MNNIKEVRRYKVSDIPGMLDTLGEFLKQEPDFCHIKYDRGKVDELLYTNVNNSFLFCNVAVTQEEDIVGGIFAQVLPFYFSNDVMAVDHLFFLLPEYRNVRVSATLINQYIAWAKARQVKRAMLSATTTIDKDRFGKLVGRFGFKEMGRYWCLDMR